MSESREVIYCEKGKTILDSDFKQIKRMDYHEPLGGWLGYLCFILSVKSYIRYMFTYGCYNISVVIYNH